MGTYKSKNQKVDINSLPPADPEPDYKIMTRQPMPSKWALNILRGKREDELKGLAYAYSRRKCHKIINEFIKCERENGAFWTAFECQEQNHDMNMCLEHESNVEMDKLRRNIKMNNEWWWRELYDENGEINEQAKWVDEFWLITKIRNFYEKLFY